MSDGKVIVRALPAAEAAVRVNDLADILLDCVVGGASVSFMADLDRAKAQAFWRVVADGAARGDRILLVAERDDGSLVCTVQVVWATPDNQPHRGDVAKMLVHRRGRKQGVGAMLLRAAEEEARKAGRTLLVLDTVTAATPSVSMRGADGRPSAPFRITRCFRMACFARRLCFTRRSAE